MELTETYNKHPQIAVIIVNWNSGELLERCLSALNRQTLRLRQIIIVDNASSDESSSGIEKLYNAVKLVRLKKNAGFAAGNNIGISEAKDCDWIALVNPDAFPEPDWLEQLIKAVHKYPEYAFFGSRMLAALDSTTLDGTGDIYHVSGLSWRRGHGQSASERDLKAEEIFAPCAAAALYRREAFVEVGGFDESYFGYFEDMDLGFRLRLAGYRCLYVPDAVVYHVGSATTGKHSDFTVYHGHRNLVWTYCKDMPWPLFWLYLPQHLLLNLATIFWFCLSGRARVILSAKWDALKGLPRILRQRRRIQAGRRVDAWALRRIMAKGLFTPYGQRQNR